MGKKHVLKGLATINFYANFKGAKEYQPITDHSQEKGTFVTASVVDPFGNILGIMTNFHYLEILTQKQA